MLRKNPPPAPPWREGRKRAAFLLPSLQGGAGGPVSSRRLPTTERANRWVARRLRVFFVGSKCCRLAMTAIRATVFPGVDLQCPIPEKVVRTVHGSSRAGCTLADLLPIARHNPFLLMRGPLPVPTGRNPRGSQETSQTTQRTAAQRTCTRSMNNPKSASVELREGGGGGLGLPPGPTHLNCLENRLCFQSAASIACVFWGKLGAGVAKSPKSP